MEWLLLLLVGGLTAGVGLWAATGKKEEKPPFADFEGGPGPRSSPDLPGGGSSPSSEADRGKPVMLGKPGSLEEALRKGPSSVEAKVVPAGERRDREGQRKPGGQRLKVPHSTDQIIPRSSKHAHHRRSLQNAETLVEKQKDKESIEIYDRVKNRIADEDIRAKLNENIEAIKKWQSGLEQTEDESLRFPEIVIPLSTQLIALGHLTEGLKEVSKGLVTQISHAFAAASQLQTAPAGVQTASPPMAYSAREAPSTATTPPAFPQFIAVPYAVPTSESFPPPVSEKPPAFPGTPPSPGLGESPRPSRTPAAETQDLPPGLQVDEYGNLITDGWTDEDFDREWEKYKNLPLNDRRSGKDRRLGLERRTGAEALRKDRRSGIERRKKDLLKERDDFLKKLEEHKKRKSQLDDFRAKKKPPPGPTLAPARAPTIEKPDDMPVFKIEHAVIKIGKDEGEELKPEPKAEKQEEEPKPTLFQMTPPEALDVIGLPSALDEFYEGAEAEAGIGEEKEEGLPGLPSMESGEGMAAAPAMGAGESDEGLPEIEPQEEKKPPVQEIHGILELKPPEEDDAPFLTLTYDFNKIPDSFKLSRDYHTMEYAYYKYKPMLMKAQEFSRRKMLKNALNYYRVIKSQNIPPEFKRMINRNIKDITEYLEKFLMGRG